MRHILDYADGRPTVTGAGGSALSVGDVVTGESNVRAIVLQNAFVRVTYDTPSVPGAETLAHYLWSKNAGGTFDRVVSAQYGDWTYPTIGATVAYDRATVTEASDDAVEVTFRVDAFDCSTAFGGLGLRRRDDAAEALDYPINSSSAKSDMSFTFDKTIRLERDREGYFAGYKTFPDVFPGNLFVPASNDNPDYGEFEIGPGADVAVSFSMVGGALIATARHPAWGANARWSAAEAAAGGAIGGRPCNMGTYDPDGVQQPTYWGLSAVQDTQHDLFPYRPTSGPWVVAALRSGRAHCVYMIMRHPMFCQSSQYDPAQFGTLRIVYYRQKHGTDGNKVGPGVFIGCVPYAIDATSGHANEPTLALQSAIAARALALEWPP